MGDERHRSAALTMPSVLVIVEGQTEERFVNDCLSEYFAARDLWLRPVLIPTKLVAAGPNVKGGTVEYGRFRKLIFHCLGGGHYRVTTMLDLYALPETFPGVPGIDQHPPLDRATVVEAAIGSDINNVR